MPILELSGSQKMKNLLSGRQGRGNQNAFPYHGALVAEKK